MSAAHAATSNLSAVLSYSVPATADCVCQCALASVTPAGEDATPSCLRGGLELHHIPIEV